MSRRKRERVGTENHLRTNWRGAEILERINVNRRLKGVRKKNLYMYSKTEFLKF